MVLIRLIYVVASSCWTNWWILFSFVNFPWFVHFTVDRHLSSLHFEAILNSATVNICVHVNTYIHVCWVYSYAWSVWVMWYTCIQYYISNYCQTDFQNGWTDWHSRQQCMYTDFLIKILTWGYIHWFQRQRERETERGREKHQCDRETLTGCTLYVPWLGIEPTTFWCIRRHSNQVTHLARDA